MAVVDSGQNQLFEQTDNNVPSTSKRKPSTDVDEEETSRFKAYEETIERLTEENNFLQRTLSILTRPSDLEIEDVDTDGPLLQVLFMNNTISKQCRQEIENCIINVISKNQKKNHVNKSTVYMKPQESAFALPEDPDKRSASSVKTTSEAFKVVGSVLYLTSFCIDKLGQPLVNENPQLTDGWEVPIYNQVFTRIFGLEDDELEIEEKRPKALCFNCGSVSHQLRDCPEPKDMAAINERRKEFMQSNNQATPNARYHEGEIEERFAKYKPGIISEELLKALGIGGDTLPPLIYRMRQLGYPPGWLKEAETESSGLSLYNESASKNDNVKDYNNPQTISYDVSKLVDFPGFNVAAPYKMKDEFKQYGSIPIQSTHMKNNYAAYLSTNFPQPSAVNNKRQQECDSSPQPRKRNKRSPDQFSNRSSDIDSDPGPSHSFGSDNFKFQPPMPPGSPSFSSPPPLPTGTPPTTPTPPPLPKGTPPPTPTNGSPALPGRNWIELDASSEATEDELSLEELEEQQRLIWAALQNADTATNSDSDTPLCRSPSMSTPVHSDLEKEEDSLINVKEPDEPSQVDGLEIQNISTISPGPVEDDNPQSPESLETQDKILQSPGQLNSEDDDPVTPHLGAGDCASPENYRKFSVLPHRSQFAVGIVPFEQTPDYAEVSETTGRYLKIRNLLKSSPQSLSKQK